MGAVIRFPNVWASGHVTGVRAEPAAVIILPMVRKEDGGLLSPGIRPTKRPRPRRSKEEMAIERAENARHDHITRVTGALYQLAFCQIDPSAFLSSIDDGFDKPIIDAHLRHGLEYLQKFAEAWENRDRRLQPV